MSKRVKDLLATVLLAMITIVTILIHAVLWYNNDKLTNNEENILMDKLKNESLWNRDSYDMNHIITRNTKNESSCDVLYKSCILMGVHHKTGTDLLVNLRKTLRKYARKRRCKLCFKQEYHMNGSQITNWLNNIYTHNQAKLYNERVVIFNIIRSPINILYSAYNFHKHGGEYWNTVDFDKIKHLHGKHKLFKQERNRCISNLYLNLFNDSSIKSISDLYQNHLNISYGLYIEYLRLLKCNEFGELYSSFRIVKDINDNINVINTNYTYFTHNLRLENFMHSSLSFDKSCEIILNKLGIFNEQDRNILMNRFISNDLNRWNAQKINNNQHITNKGYKQENQVKQQAIDKLLSMNILLCKYLKNLTLNLDYEWEYHHQC